MSTHRGEVLLEVDDLSVQFPTPDGVVNAVDHLSFTLRRGETLGLVGESGCGKSTTGRAIMQLPRPTSGSVTFEGQDMTKLSPKDMRAARTRMQMIFQDPISSLNPRRKVRDVVMEPLTIWKRGSAEERGALVDRTLEEVGIGCIVFSPLAQGLLTNRYLEGIPEGSRAATQGSALSPELLTEETMGKVRALNEIAERRGQSLAQMAIAWTLRDQRVTSALIGASSVAQLEDSLAALDRLDFSEEELAQIDQFAKDSGVNLWAESSRE